MTTPAMTATEAADSGKRRQILDGARQVFRAHGFDGASMGEIAKAAGVSKGTLYVYFDSKEALFCALTIEDKRIQAEAIFQLDADDPDVERVLRRLGMDFHALVERPEHISNIRMVIGAVEKFPDLGRQFYEAGPACGHGKLAAYFDAQVAAGRLAIADTRLAAQHFIDLCVAGRIRRLLFGIDDCPCDRDRERLLNEALRVFFAAYGPRPPEI